MSHTHTPEPWEVVTDCEGQCCWFVQQIGNDDPFHRITKIETDEDTARRIVACVNACAGITTEALERELAEEHGFVRAFQREREKLIEQRDELLAALRDSLASLERANNIFNGPINDTIWHKPYETLFDFMYAAIAKAKYK